MNYRSNKTVFFFDFAGSVGLVTVAAALNGFGLRSTVKAPLKAGG